jgi:hypothetical protein
MGIWEASARPNSGRNLTQIAQSGLTRVLQLALGHGVNATQSIAKNRHHSGIVSPRGKPEVCFERGT